MAKKSKKNKDLKKFLPLLLIGAGAAIVIFGQKWFSDATDKFVSGIGYKFNKLKFKFSGLTMLRVTAVMTVINQNSIGGKVESFNGSLKYGRNGQQIVPIYVNQFNLPANGQAQANIISDINVLQLGGSLVTVVQQIIGGDYKKLWLTGTLKTSFASIPVDTEITPFSE